MSPRLHILLPVHNRRATTVSFVEALRRQTVREFNLILIDDGSTDGTSDAVRTLWPTVEIVTGTGEWWWAGSLARGCEWLARSDTRDDDVLLLINDDVVIEPEFFAQGLAELAARNDTLLLARQRDAATGAEIDFGGGVRADLVHLRFAPAQDSGEINCLPTRGLFLRWRDLRRAGGFRPDRLPHYLSDYEFTLRAGRSGLKLAVAREATVGIHLGQTGRSLANLFDEPRSERFRLLFSQRYKDNPVTWSAFVALAVPAWWRPVLWLKIWINFLITVIRCLFVPVPHAVPR